MYTSGFGGMGFMDSFMFGGGFEVLFFVVFALVIGGFLFTLIRGAAQWHKNNESPRLTVDASLVSRRTEVIRHHHGGADHIHHTTSTRYYATFEVESGDRMEFSVSGQEYGLLAEGDEGRLTFQGTRFLGFERQ